MSNLSSLHLQNESILERCVIESCISLFSDYTLPLELVQPAEDAFHAPLLFCGVVGFSGEHMRGTLLLATSSEPLGRTSPATDASLREWIAELSNQLLGRIKNRLLPCGVVLFLSTPVVLRGEHIAPFSGSELKPLLFACPGGTVCVWLDSELSARIDLAQHSQDEGLSEGSSMLF